MESSASAIPASELGDIYHETAACILAFENCLSVEPLMEEGWAESRLADMKLWASSVGALAHPRSSLDRRLEFQPNPRLVLISLLRTLQEFVNICQMLALTQTSGEEADSDLRSDEAVAPPTGGTLASTTGSDSGGGPSSTAPSATIDSDPETDSATSVDSDASEGPDEDRPRGMLQKGMRNTEDVLDQLMMLGIAIRKSGTAARLRKADSSFNPGYLEAIGKLLGDLPLDARGDSLTVLIEQQWPTLFPNATQCPPIAYIDQVKDLQVFREHLKFVLIHDARRRRKQEKGDRDVAKDDKDITSHDRMQEAKDDPSDLSPKQNHLVLANLRRRHRFAYAKRHQQKLDRAVVPQRELQVLSVAPVPESREDVAPENSCPQAVPDRSVPAESSSRETPLPLESSVPVDIGETDPSAPEGEILQMISLTSQDTASRVSVSVARLHYPSPPPKIKERKWFKCPCCSQTLPEMFRDKSRWRKHVSEDLCPYTCPFEDCSSPEVLYISRATWREHVLAAHGASEYWECLACAGMGTPNKFSTADELVVHATANHKDTMSEDQILDLRDRCHTTAPPNISKCPLCPWPRGLTVEPDAVANLEHVANCIHEFSLRALPWAEFLETQIPFQSKRSTVAEAKTVKWFEMIKEEMNGEDIEDISIDGIDMEIIPIQDVDINKIDITSFHILPALPQPEVTEKSYLPQDYFDENSDESSQVERASSPAGSDLPEVKESDSGDFVPSRPYSPMSTVSSLEDLIFSHLEKNFDKEEFLPADCIYDLTREDWVRQELSREQPAQQELREEFIECLVSFASGPGKRIFLILIYCDCLKHLKSIFLSGFDDTGLPIGRSDTKKASISAVFSLDKSGYRLQKPGVTLNCFDTFSMRHLRAFIQTQWLFLAPIFSSDQFLYSLHPEQPLPLLMSRREDISGSITKVRVHRAHFPMLDISIKPVMAVAVTEKDFRRQNYEREITSLQDLQRLKNEHLISPFVAYERDGSLHTLVPWASGGNLSDFWSRRHNLVDGPRPPAPTVVLWALEQMRGLADAISTLHHNQMAQGGLSPYSILVVDDHKSLNLWTLKINGVNVPRFQAAHARGHTATTSRMGALRYAAPELSRVDGAPQSSLIDIWSIGCIYLEFLIWILDGNIGLREFRGSGNNTQYWDFRDGELWIHKVVEIWIDSATKRLEHHDQEIGSALWDLLFLIRQGLLVTMPANRANATGLMNRITEIHQKAREAPRYLYDPKVWDRKWRATPATLTVPTRSDVPQLSPQDRVPRPPSTIRDEDSSPPIVISVTEEEGKKLAESESSGSTNPDDASHSMLRDPFAERILRKIDWSSEPEVVVPAFCERCRALDLFSPYLQFSRTISYLKSNSPRCGLCQLILLKSWDGEDNSSISFRREGPYIRRHPEGFILCVIYADPESLGKKPPHTLSGIPLLPVSAGPMQQLILREWLQVCDREHDCHQSSTSRAQESLPTRLLDIGNDASAVVRLVDGPSEITRPYIALSFLWGSAAVFGTRKSNYDQYRRGITVSELPATVRDAIRIARNLGINYLWVDAFCIISDDVDDWEAASRRMEGVFSSAYCRLAAASSRSMEENMICDRALSTCLRVQDSEGRCIYISEFIDNFSQDVDGSLLNSRAWVLQDRALSCRTIYFTSTQVYMECGKGVRCETLGRIPWNKASFLGDSHFPTGALRYFGGSGILLYQNLYQLYSRLNLTSTQDRPRAIASLEERLGLALDTVCAYGIVERYLSSSLMWSSKTNQGSYGARIHYPLGEEIPSWSWMACNGPIEYFSTASEEMEVSTDISNAFRRFFSTWISTKEMKPSRIELTVPARRLAAPDNKWFGPNMMSNFHFDEVYERSPDWLLCVPIAREKQGLVPKHWIILIEQIDIDDKEVYMRVGVGSLAEEDMNADTVLVQLW
ncbi:hypothetical protein HD806DRAFT_491241 [Xylariaceae sp. AK1471]|nr:hypothetical protein HD806DRAFT_491241 [Xylariaceae sp. AK1471]